jgi:hypothetical protein
LPVISAAEGGFVTTLSPPHAPTSAATAVAISTPFASTFLCIASSVACLCIVEYEKSESRSYSDEAQRNPMP